MNHIEAAQKLGLDPFTLMKKFCPGIISEAAQLNFKLRSPCLCNTIKKKAILYPRYGADPEGFCCAQACWDQEVTNKKLLQAINSTVNPNYASPNE